MVSIESLQDYGLAGQFMKQFFYVYIFSSASPTHLSTIRALHGIYRHDSWSTIEAIAPIRRSTNPGKLKRRFRLARKQKLVPLKNTWKPAPEVNLQDDISKILPPPVLKAFGTVAP